MARIYDNIEIKFEKDSMTLLPMLELNELTSALVILIFVDGIESLTR